MALLFTGCEEPVGMTMEFPIEIMLPAEDLYSSEGAPERRVLGDPGETEKFAIPTNIYMFVVFEAPDKPTKVETLITTATKEDWDEVKQYSTETAMNGHYYNYKKTFLFKPSYPEVNTARVYVVVSDVPLILSNDNPSSEADILNITFSADNSEYDEEVYGDKFDIQKHLQNIYSSPYNYKPDGSTYYGTVKNFDKKVPALRLILYHVASKVDIMWNVPTDQQSAVRVVGVQAKNLYKGDCKLFRPTENTVASAYTSDATFDLAGNSVGTWWNGRNYFYTIPYHYGGKFPLQVDFTLQNVYPEAENICHLVAKKTMPAVFTPWMRGMLTVSGPLGTEKTVTVDLDE